jgi:hypothetical protein
MSQIRGKHLSGGASLAILLFFFLPWMSVSCLGEQFIVSGYDMALKGQTDFLLLLIPFAALAVLGVLYAVFQRWISEDVATGAQIAATAVAVAGLGIKYGQLSREFELVNSNPFTGPIMGATVSVQFEYGLWLTLAALLLIIGGAAWEWYDRRRDSDYVADPYMPGVGIPTMGVPMSGAPSQASPIDSHTGMPPDSYDYSPNAVFSTPAAGPTVSSPSPFAPVGAGQGDQPLQPRRTEVLRQEPQVMAWLVIREGVRAGHQFRLGENTGIGRDASNEVILDDGSMSSHHARIKLEDGKFFLHDLASTNGTFILNHESRDWQQIYREEIKDGQQIKFGRTVLHFMMIDPATTAAA